MTWFVCLLFVPLKLLFLVKLESHQIIYYCNIVTLIYIVSHMDLKNRRIDNFKFDVYL